MSDFSKYTEHELALLISQGNREAFRYLFDEYRNKIYSVCWKFSCSETVAEDLAQEIFIRIWENREKFAAVDKLNGYLNSIIRNHIFNYLRREGIEHRMKLLVSENQEAADKPIIDSIYYKELQGMIHDAVSQLPPQQKKVYQLSRLEGLKHQEIADHMGIARSTVKGHMVEALNFIRNYLLTRGEMIGMVIVSLEILLFFS